MKKKIKIAILLFVVFSMIFGINQLLKYFQISLIPAMLIYALILLVTTLIIFKIINLSELSISAPKENSSGFIPYLEEEEEVPSINRDDYLVRVHNLQDDFSSLKKTVMPLCLQLEEFSKKITAMTGSGQSNQSKANNPNSYMGEMKDNIAVINENSIKAFKISDNISNSAEKAMDLARTVKEGINAVTEGLAESLRHSKELYTQSEKIGEIIEMISEIATKTSILSINASIVSARAGKQGKTFEIVAKEIRELSSETNLSLRDIEEVVKEIQNVIHMVVEKIKSSEERINREMQALLAVAGSLQGVVLGVEVVRTVSQVVKEKSEQQNKSIDMISEFIAGQLKQLDLLYEIGLGIHLDNQLVNNTRNLLEKMSLDLEKAKQYS